MKEKKEPGSGGLFSIFVSDLCKGCAECVTECGHHEALKMVVETSFGDETDLTWAKSRIIALFPAQDGIVTALNALVRRLLRIEVLFGTGTVINGADLEAALAS